MTKVRSLYEELSHHSAWKRAGGS